MTIDIKELWSDAQSKFVNESQTEWIYNGQNLPEMVTTRSNWVNGNWLATTNDIQYRFYYQNYFPSSVKSLAFDNSVNIFPVPASDAVTVDISWNNPEAFTVSLVDIKGSVLGCWKEQPTTSYKKQLDISQLPNANYFITVSSESYRTTKRIIVSH
jgi:hypothetical protein